MNVENSADIAFLLERLGRILQNEGHSTGLKPTQWEALRYLVRANKFSRSPSAVTSYLGMTKGTVSQTLMALERKSLISKKTGSEDRRNIRLEVTAVGRKLLDDDPISQVTNVISKLPRTQHSDLGESLKTLMQRLLESRGDRPFGVCNQCKYFERGLKKDGKHHCQLLKVVLSNKDSDSHCIEMEPGRD